MTVVVANPATKAISTAADANTAPRRLRMSLPSRYEVEAGRIRGKPCPRLSLGQFLGRRLERHTIKNGGVRHPCAGIAVKEFVIMILHPEQSVAVFVIADGHAFAFDLIGTTLSPLPARSVSM